MSNKEKPSRDFRGVWIDKDIWLDEEMSWMEKLLFTEIQSLEKNKECHASNSYFANFFKLSKDRISRMISSLKNKGFIEVDLQYKPGTKEIEKRVITTHGFTLKKASAISPEILEQLQKNKTEEQPSQDVPEEHPQKSENKDKPEQPKQPKQPKQTGYTEEFEKFWEAYRKHGNKASSFREFKKAVKKHGIEVIMNGVDPFWEWALLSYNNDKQFVTRGQNFLKDELFLETEDHLKDTEALRNRGQKKSQQQQPAPTYNSPNLNEYDF